MENTWLPHIRSPSDSWVGVVDGEKRRRLQNRLAQRARRMRAALAPTPAFVPLRDLGLLKFAAQELTLNTPSRRKEQGD